ncbi:hypothetical protein [Ornithinimicrobium cerasi]|uniref:hypothetical protein n=1 Tax=Ornithinimicrobium cerasi TaxID=2248773 RepID=UPI00137B39EF|nr:hypothetical protein [Ornithinimicrobium cerasi]
MIDDPRYPGRTPTSGSPSEAAADPPDPTARETPDPSTREKTVGGPAENRGSSISVPLDDGQLEAALREQVLRLANERGPTKTLWADRHGSGARAALPLTA